MTDPRRLWLIRLIVSALALALLLFLIPARQLWAAFGRLSPGALIFAIVAFLVIHVVAAFKWRTLMVGHVDLPARLWVRAHFAGLVANLCLPGLSGGDLVRAGWVMRAVARPEQIAVASVADRVIDAVSLLVLSTVGLAWVGSGSGPARHAALVVWAAMIAALVAAATAHQILRRRSAVGWSGRIAGSVDLMLARPRVILAAFGLSLVAQGGLLLINAQLGTEVGVDATLGVWLVAWPLSKVVAFAPISLSGIGVREAALVAFMRPFGAEAAAVMAAGLLWDVVIAASGIVGALMTFVLTRERRAVDGRLPT